MAALRQSFTIRVTRDRVIDLLSLGALGGAVICAGIAGGVEAAGAVAVLAARMSRGAAPGRYRELRFDGDAWTAVAASKRNGSSRRPGTRCSWRRRHWR